MFEVGPRDGLQNEAVTVPAEIKVQLVEKLADAGLRVIESGAFVSPKWVPQMATSSDVFQQIEKRDGISYPMLVPNMKGLELAHAVGVREVALFAAATETFSQKNTNCSIAESIDRFNGEVIDEAQRLDIKVRGYVSCVLGCPYEGDVSMDTVLMITEKTVRQGLLRGIARRHHRRRYCRPGAGAGGKACRKTGSGGKACGALSRYLWPGAGQYSCGVAGRGISVIDSSVAGPRWMPLCQGCNRKCCHRGRCLHVAWHGYRYRCRHG